MQTRALTLRDGTSPPAPARRKISFKTRTNADAPANRVVLPGVGSAGDPTLHGGTLAVYNSAGSGEKVAVTLPAGSWTPLGSSSSPSGYRYTGSDANGPVARVIVKNDQLLVRGGKSNWVYTLDEPSQGRIALRLTLGSGAAWCGDAPAKSSGNPPSTTSNDRVDKFTAQTRTPAPASCPPMP